MIRRATTALPRRLPALDGLRAIFVVVVMFHHVLWAAPEVASNWLKGGWTGLDGFFVLSGFLIGGLLFDEISRTGRLRYFRFLARRLLRLYPALLVALAAMATVSMTADHGVWSHLAPTIWRGISYTMNWAFGHHEAVGLSYTQLWSLAVEFQFYLALPLLILVLSKLRFPVWSWAAVLVAVMGLVWWRRVQLWTGPDSFPLAYVSADTRVDTLLWGVLVALAIRQAWLGPEHRIALRILAPVAVAWLVWVTIDVDSRDGFPYRWGLTLSGLANAIVLAWVVLDGRTVVAKVLGSAPMRWLGARSYSMYLYHYPLFFYVGQHLTSLSPDQRVGVAMVGTVPLADLSYRLVERPALRLKDRWVQPAAAKATKATNAAATTTTTTAPPSTSAGQGAT